MEDKFIRQKDFFNPNEGLAAVIVGAGTIGSWLAFGLAKLGVKDIYVVDNDRVELHNTPNQTYTSKHAESAMPKVIALRRMILEHTGIEIAFSAEKITRTNPLSTITFRRYSDGGMEVTWLHRDYILFSAVDNMATRTLLYRSAVEEGKEKTMPDYRFFIDGRMAGEVIQVYAFRANDPKARLKYETTLHSDNLEEVVKNEEIRAISQVKCTAQSVIDVSMTIAGLMINLYRKESKGHTIDFDYTIDMRNLWYLKGVAQ